ncbi:Pkinase Tyr domain containing protein [Trichuris trichiura]|uniref:Pkinase Tyr domain containing protein n=1 Tax=Trichuris trichiura TaxID=36087 RepID=A0A077YYH4_TRITR|nr:Pkinase Tyr domain containing protein [Trichuris trichiura]
MESRCNTVYKYPLMLPGTSIPGLQIKLGCETVIDSRCVTNSGSFLAVDPFCKIASFSLSVIAPLCISCLLSHTTKVIYFQNTISNFLIKGLTIGHRYSVHICAIYDESTEGSIRWNITARHEVDLGPPIHEKMLHGSSTPHTAFFVVPTLLILLMAFCSIFVVYRCRRTYKKSIGELAENPYVVQPRRFDHWEISRSKLDIFLDQKLGSGAFGAVYKGKMNGRLVSNKMSNSALAENWTKTEDCEIAVKMLPEYADEAAKSDFCKEINLMKRLGYHEKLVNMLACITADEPFCLIVEYCTDGDLLHYLRDRRKYMVKLEELGIDIQNAENHGDMDLDKILCLKDLVSFSWQISVGLEYLSQKGYVHRDVAARNVLVDRDKRIKIGDFGLCRYVYSDMVYMGKGGRLPVKWMALEAIKNCEFTTKSDVWSFGVLLFEIITLGGSPYPGIQPMDMEKLLEEGHRMEQPVNCPDDMYSIMLDCWQAEPSKRPDFTEIRERLRGMLEKITEDYGYTGLSQSRDYYNVINSDNSESAGNVVIMMEETQPVATTANVPCGVVG